MLTLFKIGALSTEKESRPRLTPRRRGKKDERLFDTSGLFVTFDLTSPYNLNPTMEDVIPNERHREIQPEDCDPFERGLRHESSEQDRAL